MSAHFPPLDLELNVIETGVNVRQFTGQVEHRTMTQQWAALQTFLANHHRRRLLIQELVTRDIREGRTILVVSDRLGLAEWLTQELQNNLPIADIGYLHGSLTQVKRALLWKSLGAGELRCLVATNIVDLAQVPLGGTFDTVHIATPPSITRFANRINVLYRPKDPGHHAVIRYYLDDSPWLFGHLKRVEMRLYDTLTVVKGFNP